LKRSLDVRPAMLQRERALPRSLANLAESTRRERKAELLRHRFREELCRMVSAAARRARGRGNRRHLGRGKRLFPRESADHDLREPRPEIVGAAELEREEDRARAAAIRRSGPKGAERRGMNQAASASLRACRRERLTADGARRGGRLRDRAPARRTDSAAEDFFHRV